MSYPRPESEQPSLDELIEYAQDGGCTTSCEEECWTETDGECEHGHPSWLLRMGLI
jgi:hypothetical protein